MKRKNNKKLSIITVAGLTCLIPGLIIGCGNNNADTDLFFTKGVKFSCGETLSTLKVDSVKLKDSNGNYSLFLKNSEGDVVNLNEIGEYSVVNPTITPKEGTSNYFIRVKVKYIGIKQDQKREIDAEDYFSVVPTFSSSWLLCDDGYYYNVKDGVLNWNDSDKSQQLEINGQDSQSLTIFGSDEKNYVVSEGTSYLYDYVGAQIYIDAIASDGATDASLKAQGWTFGAEVSNDLSLKYNLNGTEAENKPEDVLDIKTGSKVEVSSVVPTRRGYEFVAWNSSANGNGKSYVACDKIKISQSGVTLYAIWQAKTYNINLDFDGGEYLYTDRIPKNYTFGKAIDLPTPKKEGYTFDGWYMDDVKFDYIGTDVAGDLQLTARWNIKNYSITLITNGGTIKSGNVTEYNIENKAILPTDIEMNGYVFDGWYSSYTPANGDYQESWTGKTSEVGTAEKGDKIFYAKWKIKSYVIILDAQDGNIEHGDISGESKKFGSLLPYNVVKEGYNFVGWFTEVDGGIKCETVEDYGDVETVTLYAHWTPKKCTMLFEYNGGLVDGVEGIESKTVQYKSAIGTLPIPEKFGYAFGGWFDNRSFEGEALTSDMIWRNFTGLTVYAKWIALENSYKVKYYLEKLDGSFEESLVETKEEKTGSSVSAELKSIDGYEYNKNAEEVLSGKVLADGSLELSVYYNRKTYSLTFNENDGEFEGEVKGSYKFGEEFSLPVPSKYGYEFVGWFESEDLTGSPINKILSSDFGDKIYYAKYDRTLFNIILNKNGGTLKEGESDVTNHTYGHETQLPELVRDGYTFEGWYDNSDFSGVALKNIDESTKEDLELFAKWKEGVYKVTLNLNGGAVQSNNVEKYTYGKITYLPTNVIRAGYKFAGWYNNAELSGNSIVAVSRKDFGDREYFAKWEDCKVTFKAYALPSDVSVSEAELPEDFVNTEHIEKYTIANVNNFKYNGKTLTARYVKINGSQAKNEVDKTFSLYGDTEIVYVFDYVTTLRIEALVVNGETEIEETLYTQYGQYADLTFDLSYKYSSSYPYEGYNHYCYFTDSNGTEYFDTDSITLKDNQHGEEVVLTPHLLTGYTQAGEYTTVYNNKIVKNGNEITDISFDSYSVELNKYSDDESDNYYIAPSYNPYNMSGYKLLGWAVNEAPSNINDLIKPKEKFEFDTNNDRLIGFWEVAGVTITIDLDGGTIVDTYGDSIATSFTVENSNYFRLCENNIYGTKQVGSETYYLKGFKVVSPLNYEELGYEMELENRGVDVDRRNSEGRSLDIEHDFTFKALWSKDIGTQKVKLNLKKGEHVYYKGEEVTELSYEATTFIDRSDIFDGSCMNFVSLTFKRDGYTDLRGSLIFTNDAGIPLSDTENNEYNEFIAVAGGVQAEIFWTQLYKAEVKTGSIPGVEMPKETISWEYTKYDYYSDLVGSWGDHNTKEFYNIDGYICTGLSLYRIDTNERINDSTEEFRANIGNMYIVPTWTKMKINPGKVVLNEGEEDEETLNATLNHSLIMLSSNINRYDDLEAIASLKGYEVIGFMHGDEEYLFGNDSSIEWRERKYLVSSTEEGDTYIYRKQNSDDSSDVTTTYRVIKDGVVIEKGDVVSEFVENTRYSWRGYYIFKKPDGTILGYSDRDINNYWNSLYSAIEDDLSYIDYDKSTQLETIEVTEDTDDEFVTWYRSQSSDSVSKYYIISDNARLLIFNDYYYNPTIVEKNSEGEINYCGYEGTGRGNYYEYVCTLSSGETFTFYKGDNYVYYSEVVYTDKEIDSDSRIDEQTTFYDEELTILWRAKKPIPVRDNIKVTDKDEQELIKSNLDGEIKKIRNNDSKYDNYQVIVFGDEDEPLTIPEFNDYENTFLLIQSSYMEFLMSEMSYMPSTFYEIMMSKNVTIDDVGYSWEIVGDEVRIFNDTFEVTSDDKILMIGDKEYIAEFDFYGLKLISSDGYIVEGYSNYSYVFYDEDICQAELRFTFTNREGNSILVNYALTMSIEGETGEMTFEFRQKPSTISEE